MTAHTDLLLQCFQYVASAARPALERCMAHAIAELQTREMHCMQVTERDALGNSWRYLEARKTEWPSRFVDSLLAELNQTISKHHMSADGDALPARPAPSGRYKMDAVGLVDEDDMTQVIRGQRLLQDLIPAVEQALTELDALVCSAMGLDYVAPERNPLRPAVFARLLQGLMTVSVEDNAATSLSFGLLAKPLGQELDKIYRQCSQTLKHAQIRSAGYQFRVQAAPSKAATNQVNRQTDRPDDNAQGNAMGNADNTPAQADFIESDLSDQHLKARLLRDFLSPDFRGHQQRPDPALAAPYYDNIEQELADLTAASGSRAVPFSAAAQQRLARIPAVDRPQRVVDASTPLSEQVWGPYGTSRARNLVRTQLKKEATKVSQALGLDVVRQLVDQVAHDPRLLGPVREAIVALEPSLLRLALVDPRFFSDERHVGRQLMERVAQRSFTHNDEFSPEFAVFFQDISDCFNHLNANVVKTIQPFGTALATLEQTWAAQDQQDFDRRQQVLQALRFAEERQSAADQIAFDLSARSDLEKVPGKVLDFLFGPWALAMAHARLIDTRNQIDPEGFGSVVPDLVWSVKRDATLKQPGKLIEMIPGLLDKLHSGLGLLGQDPKENEVFFDSLMKLHRPVLRLRRLKSQRDAEESTAALLEFEETPISPAERLEKLRAQADAPLWMGRSDLDAAGFEDTQPTAPAGLGPDDLIDDMIKEENQETQAALETAPSALLSLDHNAPETREQAALVLQSLRTGRWVDLYSKRQWLRAQLVWASSHATLFMFISHGGRPHSMTKRSCEKLIAQRLLRPVDSHGVVAQALDAVTLSAAAQHLSAHTTAQQAATQGELESV